MVMNNRRINYPVVMVLLLSFSLSYWLMTRASKAYCAVSPVVSTLSSITEGAVTPVRIAADQSGNMYVTDPRGGGVLKYNSAGNLLQKISTTGRNLLGIAVAKNGDILVSQGSSVAVYSASGAKTAEFGVFGTANGIAVDDTGAVYVVDSKNNNIQAFSANYAPVGTFGSAGAASGQFKQPTGITFEKSSGQLAVVDTLNGRVQFFTTSGVYQKTVGSFGAGPLKFTSPQAVAFEYSPDGTSLNRMYVVDSFQANVQVIDAVTTSFLRYIGSYGTRGGQMVTPGDILLDPFNRLIIPNGTGNLAVFGVELSAPPPGSGTTFTPPSTGSNPPALTLNPLSPVTKNSSITISGTATIGSSVSVNGTPANVDASGNWNLTVSLTQQGLNNFIVTASKDASTSSISAYVTLDTTVPVITLLIFPQTGSTTSNPIQIISGSVSDVTATSVTFTINGVSRAVPVNDGLFNTAAVLGIGSNIISVVATDAAGIASQPHSSTVIYDPLAPAVTIATPGGAVTGNPSYTVTGTAPANSQVTVNGVPATMTVIQSLAKTAESSVPAVTGTQWTATIPLQPGVNQINIITSVVGNPVVSTTTSSVNYAPGQPSLAITSPVVDSAAAKALSVISGTASTGTTIMAIMNGVSIPVNAASDGTFTVRLPEFSTPGTYAVTVSAIDTNGKISSSTRTLFYNPAQSVLTVVDATPPAIKVSSVGGVVIARDKNGLIATPNNSNGTAFLDLSGAVYDQASLNIYALTPAGLSSRNGDINGDGNIDLADALLAMQISLGVAPAPAFEQLLRGDVAPLVNHVPVPDGKVRLDDAITILQKTIGIEW